MKKVIVIFFVIILLLFLKKLNMHEQYSLEGTWGKDDVQIDIIETGDDNYIRGLLYKGELKNFGKIGGYKTTGVPMRIIWEFTNAKNPNNIHLIDYRFKNSEERLAKVDEKHFYIYDLNNKLIETWNRVK